jgi:hypothetical protein
MVTGRFILTSAFTAIYFDATSNNLQLLTRKSIHLIDTHVLILITNLLSQKSPPFQQKRISNITPTH